MNYCIAKSCKGKEFLYAKDTVILCRSKKQAELIAEFLNLNNNTSTGGFKLNENEIWHLHKDIEPCYKVSRVCKTTGKIIVKYI